MKCSQIFTSRGRKTGNWRGCEKEKERENRSHFTWIRKRYLFRQDMSDTSSSEGGERSLPLPICRELEEKRMSWAFCLTLSLPLFLPRWVLCAQMTRFSLGVPNILSVDPFHAPAISSLSHKKSVHASANVIKPLFAVIRLLSLSAESSCLERFWKSGKKNLFFLGITTTQTVLNSI